MPIVLQIVSKAVKRGIKTSLANKTVRSELKTKKFQNLVKKNKQSNEPFKIYSDTPNLLWTKDKTQKKRLVKTLTNKAKKK